MQKWIMAGLISVASLFAIVVMLVNFPGSNQAEESGPTFTVPDRPVDAEAAQVIYKNSCIACHGTDLQGGMGPALSTIGAKRSKEQLFKVISSGRGGMPAFEKQLSEDELITIVTWLYDHK